MARGRAVRSRNARSREFRKNLALAGSDAGGHRTAAIDTLIKTCLCGALRIPEKATTLSGVVTT